MILAIDGVLNLDGKVMHGLFYSIWSIPVEEGDGNDN